MPPESTSPERPDSAAPGMLIVFIGSILVMVLAIVVIGRTGSEWADIGAVVLLLGITAALGAVIARALRDDE
jgi:hypothetical protein